ncbi:MAG: hypothetical protein Q9170_006324, partial [Blastenia crenularia]
MASSSNSDVDVEHQAGAKGDLGNSSVSKFSWKDVSVSSKSRITDSKPTSIIAGVDGIAKAGEVMAIMGPSGSGKTTLLNVLARRNGSSNLDINGTLHVNDSSVSTHDFRSLSSYVEQEDALIGSLTVRETIDFAGRLSLPSSVSTKERRSRVEDLLSSFGLRDQANVIVGTPIRKGISGGQKRRLSIASLLITGPKILFLDEPTSGLDSTASYEVIRYLKNVAQQHQLIVIASIHQPSTATFESFDKLLLLSAGRTCYFGPVASVRTYMEARGSPIPHFVNPAEFLLDVSSSDFARENHDAGTIQKLHADWQSSPNAEALHSSTEPSLNEKAGSKYHLEGKLQAGFLAIVLALLHRSFIKSYRDVVAYGIRFAMYAGLAIMMGTVWLRLPETQSSIQPFTNAIFFGSAFMSFMAVAYVPAFLEDRATFIKERANGLYGATSFMISNFLIGLPYLFLISLIFSIIAYWLNNFRPSATAFFTWVMWLFLDLVAGESLVVLMSSIFPNFVIALALTAFANGLWMSVGGFLVSPKVLNVFWRYVFHYIDYAPTDTCWPSPSAWHTLNASLSGNLIQNIQPAAPCYLGPYQNATLCEYVDSQWTSEAFQASTAIGLSYPTESCPVLNLTAGERPAQECTLGDQPVYTVNATSIGDVVAGVRFAGRHNVRLVVRDTGHDLLRRSTGYGSLQVWIRYLRDGIVFQERYESTGGCAKSKWRGSAFAIRGGYTWSDVLGDAARRGVIVVGGGTPSVGCIGGWMQGGGHGPAAHDFGLGADQVLEAQVVLANGQIVTASPCQHPDLFFAIRGGGGGTYGVVVSTVVKAYPTSNVTAQQLSLAPLNSTYMPDFMKAVELLHKAYPYLLDKGFSGYGSWSIASPTPLVYNYNYTLGGAIEANFTTGFTHTLSLFRQSPDAAKSIFAPMLRQLAPFNGRSLFINITYSSFPTYAAFYSALSGIESPIGSSAAVGSRLLDCKALTSPDLNHTLQILAGTPEQYTSVNLVLVGGGQIARDGADPFSGVNPAWRTSYLHNIVARGWAPGADEAKRKEVYSDITDVKVQAMKDLAPRTGAYMNEGDRFDPEYLKDFYGENAAKLSVFKRNYDPK